MKSFLHKTIEYVKHNYLFLLSVFALIFIPLFPKIPLFDILPGYIVRVRTEDVLIAVIWLVFLYQLYKRQVTLQTPVSRWIGAYAVVGFCSVVSAIFIIKTVPLELLHVGKTALHYFRYIEYFSLFFILYNSIKTKQQAKAVVVTLVLIVIALSVYGIGQKYLYWPVYSTMNREFSKGIRLYLMPHARVQSTFAGHYDLGGYLALTVPIVMAILLASKKSSKRLQLTLHLAFWLGVWLLIVSAARSSFIAFGLASLIVLLGATSQYKLWSQKIKQLIMAGGYFGLVIGILFLGFGGDMTDRFLTLIDSHQMIHNVYHGFNGWRKNTLNNYILIPLGLKAPEAPANAIAAGSIGDVLTATDQQPSKVPSDVFVSVPITESVATVSASGETVQIEVEKERTYSDNAFKFGLSMAIRLDTLWPQAIRGFWRNPVSGSGYATLNKETPYHYTEADSTDNNFLRTLGETGLLGFLSFYGAIVVMMYFIYQAGRKQTESWIKMLAIGFIAGSVALLVNAVYIDVYAASKVAMSFWAVGGAVLAITQLKNKLS